MGTVIIRFTDQESDLIKQEAHKDSRSINSWCKLTLLEAIRGVESVRTIVHKGNELIEIKRGSKGRFTKKETNELP